ncbi:glycosyltransferase family 4 protein [Leptolyngbya sp. FACHB-16]|nr:glycosyltransferase family 4 protein [Leptolyngbya sp. FACHB-8]MBD2154529.1 glycosyltransferase family 4 protein [Leptolyngbya sp. FACHB-16]
MRLLKISYAGDYREAVERFALGGEETYYAQRYSVDTFAELSRRVESIAHLCYMTDEPYSELLDNGVRAIGAGLKPENKFDRALLKTLIEQQNPTHLVVCLPDRWLLKWAIKNQVKTMAVLADSFTMNGFRDRIRNFRLARLLNNRWVEWVGNHGLNSSIMLKQIGVNPQKVIPWDWPHQTTPEDFSPKELPDHRNPYTLIFVGQISEAKGVGDVLNALKKLRLSGLPVSLQLVGSGCGTEQFKDRIKELEIEEWVNFLGTVPNKEVLNLMRQADLVLVPSRHDYPEGLPMTIYEGLCSRTPIVASDHPMFQSRLIHGVNATIFSSGNSDDLAAKIKQTLSDPLLYQKLSFNSATAWKELQIPVKAGELLERWLSDSPEDYTWLSDYSLASSYYSKFGV